MKHIAIIVFFLGLIQTSILQAQSSNIDSAIALITGTWKWDNYYGGFAGLLPTAAWSNIHVILTQDAQDSANRTVSYTSYLDTAVTSQGRALVSYDSLPWVSTYILNRDVFAAAMGSFPDTFPIEVFPLKDTLVFTHYHVADDFFYAFVRDSFPDGGIPTGTKVKISQKYLQIYPNPVKNVLHIKSGQNDIQEIFVFNSLGEKVWNEENPLSQSAQVYLSGIPKGLYFVRVKTTTGVFVEKIILE